MRAYANAYRGLPREIWLLSLALFVNRCGTMVLPFLTLFLHEDLGMDEGHAAQLLALYGLGAIVGVMLSGRLTDRFGAVRTMTSLLALSVPMFAVIPWLNSIPSVAVAIFLLAVVSEGVRPANSTAVAHYATLEDQTRAFGLQRMALNLGVSFGPAIGGFLAEVNYDWLFYADAASTLACAAIVAYSFGWRGESEPDDAADPSFPKPPRPARRSPFGDRPFLILLGLILLTAVIFFQVHATYPLYLTDHYGLKKSELGLLFAVNTILIVIFEMLLVDYARRWDLVRAIGWGCLLSCLGFAILPLSTAVWFCVLSMIVLTVGEMLSMPLASGWVGTRSAGGNRGMYMACYSLTYSIANVIAPLLGGWAYGIDPNLIWYASYPIGLVCLAGCYVLSRHLALPSGEKQNPDA